MKYALLNALCLLLCAPLWLIAQPARTFVLGDGARPWASGGRGTDPIFVLNARTAEFEQTNAPGGTIDFDLNPGWIAPLRFDESENIAARVLLSGKVTAPTSGRGLELQLEGTVNGDHEVAFERKPTLFEPQVTTRGIWLILDFGSPIGITRVRFYPRNTVVETPTAPFHNDFLRGYEVWINEELDSFDTPDALMARDTRNEEPIVDLSIPAQYARYIKIKSLADQPFEIDEVEVYGTGFLRQGLYYTDIIDLGDRAAIGIVDWAEQAIGTPEFSSLSVRVRTGLDDTPLIFWEFIPGEGTEESRIIPVTQEQYIALLPTSRGGITDDTVNWSPWFASNNGDLIAAPNPRQYIQFQFEFNGELFTARQVNELAFAYIQPPIAGQLIAEVFPRLARAEEAATFRYAVRLLQRDLRQGGEVRGFDRIEVDTGVAITAVREIKLNGEPYDFNVDFTREDGFGISFALVREDSALLELTFDLPIFRFGTTFTGRAYNSRAPEVPQAFTPGDAIQFEPADIAELSGLSVAIPKPQIGKLIGDIAIASRIFSPNGDGINDVWDVFFNVLQLTRPAPLRLELYDLSGHRLATLIDEERGIGPVELAWDGRINGDLLLPGIYLWVLRVEADAFEEQHTGTLAIVY
jgi:hypothetical protein